MIEIDYELKDIMICALRYAIGQKTYVVEEVCSYIKKHPELIDKRVKDVMVRNLEKVEAYYPRNDNVDLPTFISLRNWLKKLEVK